MIFWEDINATSGVEYVEAEVKIEIKERSFSKILPEK
jgi:hypothetical protein